MKKATIYDFARMCNHYRGSVGCVNCPLYTNLFDGKMERCYNHIALYTDSANDKIIGWGERYLPHCENCRRAIDWSDKE